MPSYSAPVIRCRRPHTPPGSNSLRVLRVLRGPLPRSPHVRAPHLARSPRTLLIALALHAAAPLASASWLPAQVAASPARSPERPLAPALVARLQSLLDSARAASRWPAVSLAVIAADGSEAALVSGMADTTRRIPLRVTDKLLQGSVGKTYVAAVALQLVQEGRLELDAPIGRYIGDAPWFAALPNAPRITVRQLMRHQSGLVRYEFQPDVTRRLREEPFKVWTVADRLQVLAGTTPPFDAGAGWEYSDTNYIVLGTIIERLTGTPVFDEVRRRLLDPLALRETIPADRPDVPGIANGYAGTRNDLGGYDASVIDGRLQVNPQFEWTGGGMASSTRDLARWGRALYAGPVLGDSARRLMLDAVPARLGPNVRYGLGVMVRPTPVGESWGHSGFFPGYATELHHVPTIGITVALQVNVTDPYPRTMNVLVGRALQALQGTR